MTKKTKKLAILLAAILTSATIFIGCNDENLEDRGLDIKKNIENRQNGELILSYSLSDDTYNVFRTFNVSDNIRWFHYKDSVEILSANLFIDKEMLGDITIFEKNVKDTIFKFIGKYGDTLSLCNINNIHDGVSFDVVAEDTITFYAQFDSLTRDNLLSVLNSTDIIPSPLSIYKFPWVPVVRGVAYVISLIASVRSCNEDKQRECEKRIADGVRKCNAKGKDSRLVGKCTVECVERRK